MRRSVLSLAPVLVMAASAAAGQTTTVPPGTPVMITVTPAAPAAPAVSIFRLARHAEVTPVRQGCTHTGGGNIDVQSPSPDTLIITMTGVAVAYGSCKEAHAAMDFDFEQCFELRFDSPKVKKARVTLEAHVIGLLRSHAKGGMAEYSNACTSVSHGVTPLLSLCVPPHSVAGGQNLSVNERQEPVSLGGLPDGRYTLHASFALSASAPRCLLPVKGPSAEFAPDPALDPLWISYKEPFHGAIKRDLGYRIVLQVAEDSDPVLPAPQKEQTKEKGPALGSTGLRPTATTSPRAGLFLPPVDRPR
jgi:hypothetical protein